MMIALCCLIASPASAQLNVVSSSDAHQLASSIVGSGVSVSNVSLNCGPNGAGLFNNGDATNLNLDEGVLLTTGLATDVANPASFFASTAHNTAGDAALAALVGGLSTNDACILEFDFVPTDNHISVQYVFGSEEYPGFVCSSFNDVFAFFVNGPDPDGGVYSNTNVALVPGTTHPVTINNINDNGQACAPFFPEFYVNNGSGSSIAYNGFTVVLTANVAVVPDSTYTFRFAIADVTDAIYDSGVFIKGSSFSIFFCQAGNLTSPSLTGNSVEICNTDADKTVQVSTDAVTPSEFYDFVLTNVDGDILEINQSGNFDFEGYDPALYAIYGISYAGEITGLEVDGNIEDIDADAEEGCFEMTNPVFVEVNVCVDIECPEDASVFCQQGTDPDVTGFAIITGDPEGVYSADYSDEVVSTCPATEINRTWFIVGPDGSVKKV